MCGIAGALTERPIGQDRLATTLRAMRNRGPDASGSRTAPLPNAQVALLHSRLSIIDLDERSHQPFTHNGCTLVFNGEIYNYLELRRELERIGCRFLTASDTEVLLHAYQVYGVDCFDRFEGMWALALLDERNGTLLLSRDRFGEKPLFYTVADGALYFGSEVKFLVKLSGRVPTVDREQVRRYLVNGYKALYKKARTFFTDVHEFPAASYAVITRFDQVQPRSYWQLTYRPQPMSREEAVAGTREHLLQAVRLRLRADVPIAFCLSGGIDSNLLAGIASRHFNQQIHAFSIIDRDERYYERPNIAAAVRHYGCDSVQIETTSDGFFEQLRALVDYHDAPIATLSYYIHSFLSRAISEHGYRVSISGTAADELFTGYYDHYGFWLAEMQNRPEFEALVDEWRQSYGVFVNNPVLRDPRVFAKRPDERGHIFLNQSLFETFLVEPFHEDFQEEDYASSLLRKRMLNELQHESVPVILKEDDLNSMMVSVENRSPFLDRHLAEFAYSIPNEYLIQDGQAKWLLREAGRGLIPEEVRRDKRKRGFNASVESLIDRSDPSTLERLLDDGPIFDIVRRDRIAELLDQDLAENSFSKFLFSFVSAKTFLDSYQAWST